MTKISICKLFCFAVLAIATESNAAGPYLYVVEPNNPGFDYGYPFTAPIQGNVDYIYRMAKHETTQGEYANFLNSVDPMGADLLRLWPSAAEIAFNAAAASGGKYSPGIGADYPVRASWFAAQRYCNWLQSGVTEGDAVFNAYDTTTFENTDYATIRRTGRNDGAIYWLPSESEWVKAAYYNRGLPGSNDPHYFLNPYGSDQRVTTATANIHNTSGPTPVGSFPSAGLYGHKDLAGNVNEWTETWFEGDPSDWIYPPWQFVIIKGGKWVWLADHAEIRYRHSRHRVEISHNRLEGFRVCKRRYDGDLNMDGFVDFTDFSEYFLPNFGASFSDGLDHWLDGDFNGDGFVDFTDFSEYFLPNFGTSG